MAENNKLTNAQITQMQWLIEHGIRPADVANYFKVSRPTVMYHTDMVDTTNSLGKLLDIHRRLTFMVAA